MESIILIPSYNPDEKLIILTEKLRHSFPNKKIILIDDGSTLDSKIYFKTAETEFNCKVLVHESNQGKGRALKTAINYLLSSSYDYDSIITVDGDGQHSPKDILRLLNSCQVDDFVLGVRTFGKEVPLRSKFGNMMTSKVLNVLTKIRLNDTQTGLRVIPKSMLNDLVSLSGERYEFELNMILLAKKLGYKFVEVPIETIYIDDNKTSHFNVVVDSFKIYSVFIKYLISSGSSALIDILIFALVMNVLDDKSYISILISTVIARMISSIYNYLINRQFVFSEGDSHSKFKYILLVIVQFLISSVLVYVIANKTIRMNSSIIKVMVDTFLFFVSFLIQNKFIFREKAHE